METLYRVYVNTRNGCKMFFLVWADDPLAAIDKLRGVLIGPGCEYTLDGCTPQLQAGEPVTRQKA